MKIWQAFVLGLIQGLSEFLPVSSSGHLLLAEKIGVGEPSLFFNVLLHVGTLLAVVIVLRKPLFELIRHPFQKKTLYLIIASIPTACIALIFKFFAPSLLDGAMRAFGFMLTSVSLFVSEKIIKKRNLPLNCPRALATGFFQGIAVLPGVSRSGMTISAMLALGVERDEAAEFSFLLSIPIILASAAWETVEYVKVGGIIEAAPVAVGVITAFVSGLIAVKAMLKIVKERSLIGFSIYTFLISLATLALAYFKI